MKEAEYELKTLREAAFAISIKYADKHMSPETRLYYDATVISFNRLADMIEREGAHDPYTRGYLDGESDAKKAPTTDALQAAEDRGWNEAIDAGAKAIKKLLDKFPDGVNPGTYADGQIESLYSAIDALNALRREPRT